jgi:hypothetical protein
MGQKNEEEDWYLARGSIKFYRQPRSQAERRSRVAGLWRQSWSKPSVSSRGIANIEPQWVE